MDGRNHLVLRQPNPPPDCRPGIRCSYCDNAYTGLWSLDSLQDHAETGYGERCPNCYSTKDWKLQEPSDFPCGWRTLFAPRDPRLRLWLLDAKEQVGRLNFFVFESEDYGVLLGIDAGTEDTGDFYETHWIPLYELYGSFLRTLGLDIESFVPVS